MSNKVSDYDINILVNQYIEEGYSIDEALDILRQEQYV